MNQKVILAGCKLFKMQQKHNRGNRKGRARCHTVTVFMALPTRGKILVETSAGKLTKRLGNVI